jgi:hypothetical protein
MGRNQLPKVSVRYFELILLFAEAVQPGAVFVDDQNVPD